MVYVIFMKIAGICDLQQPLKAHLSIPVYQFSPFFSPVAPSYCKVSKGGVWNNLNTSIEKEIPHSEVMFLKPYKRVLYCVIFLK